MALTKSQRVNLITEISQRYSSEDWHLIDLTLKEFGYPTDDWSGSTDSYVVAMLQRLPGDEPLIELAKHCGANTAGIDAAPVGIDPPFWKAGMLRMFISHLSDHRGKAAGLQKELEQYGVSCFVAHNDIEPSEEWQLQIETALASCDALIAILHTGFHASKWTDQEIGYVMGRKLPIFTLKVDEVPYGFIGRFQAFQAKGKLSAEIAKEIFTVLLKHKQTHRQMAGVIVSLFEKSNSFESALGRIDYLETLSEWGPDFGERIMKAAAENSYISLATGLPVRVKSLATKWGYEPPTVGSVMDDLDDEIPF